MIIMDTNICCGLYGYFPLYYFFAISYFMTLSLSFYSPCCWLLAAVLAY